MAEPALLSRSLPPARGVVRRGARDGVLLGERVVPPPRLAPFVHHLFSVHWELRTPFLAEALPHPSVTLFFEEDARGARAEIAGVRTGRLLIRREGTGRVLGLTFRPAAFQPLLDAPMSSLTDRVVPIGQVFGEDGERWSRALLAARSVERQLALTEAFLAPRLEPLEHGVRRLRNLVERLASDRSLLRVEDVARALGLDVRSVQRQFARYVGVSPKWVIRRYRLHEAAQQLEERRPPPLAKLAASLGYADQAHFARDFKLAVGQSPRDFVARAAAPARSTGDSAPRVE